jgi:hypothetical protein
MLGRVVLMQDKPQNRKNSYGASITTKELLPFFKEEQRLLASTR